MRWLRSQVAAYRCRRTGHTARRITVAGIHTTWCSRCGTFGMKASSPRRAWETL
jgi:hypothetical protein